MTSQKAIFVAVLVGSFSGCPTCGTIPALFGNWTWTSDDFMPTTYVIALGADGNYGMSEYRCAGTCDNIYITNESGSWEACYTRSETSGQLHTHADAGGAKNFQYDWDEHTSYRLIDANTLLLDVVDEDGIRIETTWMRTN